MKLSDRLHIHMLFLCLVLVLIAPFITGVYEWSFQQRITLPSANITYASTPSFLVGRGFITLVTGHSVDPPGIYVHTTDDGHLKHGQYVWSQQARLVAQGVTPADQFGKWLVAYGQTIIVSAPLAGDRRGFAYVFNGTLRHWSQIQRLIAIEGTPGDNFGEYMSLHDDRLIVSARGVMEGSGAVYVFERQPGGLYWSRQGRLQPRDLFPGHNFGERLDLYGDTAVISARYDEESGSVSSNPKDTINRNLGSFYLFRGSGGAWSQQQKLVSFEMKNYREKQRNPALIIQVIGFLVLSF